MGGIPFLRGSFLQTLRLSVHQDPNREPPLRSAEKAKRSDTGPPAVRSAAAWLGEKPRFWKYIIKKLRALQGMQPQLQLPSEWIDLIWIEVFRVEFLKFTLYKVALWKQGFKCPYRSKQPTDNWRLPARRFGGKLPPKNRGTQANPNQRLTEDLRSLPNRKIRSNKPKCKATVPNTYLGKQGARAVSP